MWKMIWNRKVLHTIVMTNIKGLDLLWHYHLYTKEMNTKKIMVKGDKVGNFNDNFRSSEYFQTTFYTCWLVNVKKWSKTTPRLRLTYVHHYISFKEVKRNKQIQLSRIHWCDFLKAFVDFCISRVHCKFHCSNQKHYLSLCRDLNC